MSLWTRSAKWLKDLLEAAVLYRSPGFLGRLPYFGILRILVFVEGLRRGPATGPFIALIVLFAVTTIQELVNRSEPRTQLSEILKPVPRWLARTRLLQTLCDLGLSTLIGEPLFFILPIWEAAELLRFRYFAFIAAITFFVASDFLFSGSLGRLRIAQAIFLPIAGFVLFSIMTLEIWGRERAARRREELLRLAEFSEYGQTATDPAKLLARLNRLVSEVVGPNIIGSGFIFFDNELAIKEVIPKSKVGFVGETEFVVRLGSMAVKEGVLISKSISVEDCAVDKRFKGLPASVPRSVIVIPVVNHRVGVGVLWVASSIPISKDVARFLTLLSLQIGVAIEKDRLASAFRAAGHLSARTLDLDKTLDSILREITEKLGFEFSSVSLVDEFRGVVEMIRAQNLPRAWVKRARCSLGSKDIQADVLRNGTTSIRGLDERFDPDISVRYGYKDLAHIFVRVVSEGRPVGIIHGGCNRANADALLTPKNKASLESLAREVAPTLDQCRSHILLRVIAREVIHLIGADAVTLHVNQGTDTLLQAADGKGAEHLLVVNAAGSAGASGASQLRRSTVYTGPADLERQQTELWNAGVRSMAAFPLDLGSETEGILHVYFLRQVPDFSEAELRLVELFLLPMQGVIQNSLLMAGVMQVADQQVEALTFRTRMQSLATQTDLPSYLAQFAQSVRLKFDADSVTLYQYHPTRSRYSFPPTISGQFIDPEAMKGNLRSTAVPYRIELDSKELFLSSLAASIFHPDVCAFTKREKIQSVVALPLRIPLGNRLLGLLFLNYRNSTEFSPEVQAEMKQIAGDAAETIARSRLDDEQKMWPLHALAEVGRFADEQGSRVPELRKYLSHIMESAGAKGVHILVWNSKVASWERLDHDSGDWRTAELPPPKITPEGWDFEKLQKVVESERQDARIVVLSDDSGDLGFLVAEGVSLDFSARQDLIVPIVTAIRLREFGHNVSRQAQQWKCLQLVAVRIQSSPHDIGTILRLILTGVTAEEGLGFSRAAIFLGDGQNGQLKPEFAIGSIARAEAVDVWATISQGLGDREKLEDRLDRLLTLVEQLSFEESTRLCRPLNNALLRQNGWHESKIGEALESDTVVEVQETEPDVWRTALQSESEKETTYPFVCVRIRGAGTTWGVLVADNRFLRTERFIAPDTRPRLKDLADLCAAGLANAKRIAEQTQALGRDVESIVGKRSQIEMEQLHRALAHQLRDPIEKAETQLAKAEQELELGQVKFDSIRLARSLVERARQIINRSRFVVEDLNQRDEIVRESFRRVTIAEIEVALSAMIRQQGYLNSSLEFRGEYVFSYEKDECRWVFGDLPLLEQVFWELLTNASRYSRPETTVYVRMEVREGRLIVRVSNQGVILRQEDVEDSKARGWRSREARALSQEGSGFGLFVVNRLIRAHDGELLIFPTDASGLTTIAVAIPLGGAKESDAKPLAS